MRTFLYLKKPLSQQSGNKRVYQDELRDTYRRTYPEDDGFWADLYGIVYYFHKGGNTLDADNLSKPVWDALCGAGFADDKSVKLRLAGIIDLDNPELAGIDLSDVPDATANELLGVLGTERHVVYVEFGPLTKDMFRFGLSV